MRLYLRPISSVVSLLFWGYVVWNWVAWFRSTQKDSPKWRAVTTVVGLCFATTSTILSAFIFIHATITGGYSFYHPVELFCIQVGSLTALLGIVCARTGKGKLRLHVAAVSVLNLLLWFVDAIVQ